MAEPYGGAVRRCPTCDGDQVKGTPVALDNGDPHTIHDKCDCDGGWVTVDITEPCHWCGGSGKLSHLDPETGRRGPTPCPSCKAKGPFTHSWAYPQPGDIVLTDAGNQMQVAQMADWGVVSCRVWGGDGITAWIESASDLRLVVDQPNTAGRIPGTEPPGADDGGDR